MTRLDLWLAAATRNLSKDSALMVQTEIQEHYESARTAAMSRGEAPDEADRQAVAGLGDASEVNCQYTSVLLTSDEARLLRSSQWEFRAVCTRRWLKRLLVSIPMAVLLAALVAFFAGAQNTALRLAAIGIGFAVAFAAPMLPIYTPSRARVYRVTRWVAFIGMFVAASGEDFPQHSWLVLSGLWPLIWIEWSRASIRRKLAVAGWPKHLYL